MPTKIWCCETCGDTWEFAPGEAPTRNELGRVTCGRCLGGLPFEPILDAIGRVQNNTVVGEILGRSRKWVERHAGNVVSLKDAEEFATKIGVHPTVLWPELYPARTRSDEEI